jgi:DNA-binding response OmpR family regulator
MFVVEDNKDLAHLLEIHLKDLSYDITIAFDGEKGLAITKKNP